MLNPNVSKPTPGVSRLGSEFSSSQLVIATCVFLIMALVCFALGVLVGRYDVTSSRPKQSVQSTEVTPELARPLPPVPRKETALPTEEGVQKSPRPVVMPPVKTPTPGFPTSPGAASAVGEHPVPAEQAPPAPPVKPETSSTPVVEPKPVAPESKPPEQPLPPAAGAKTEMPAASTVPPPPKTEQKDAPATPATPPMEPAATGDFGIQVASFSGPNRQKMADESKKRLESNSGMKADLIASEDGKTIRLIVGHYPDKESAVKACNELRQRDGFSGSFARKR